MLSRFLRAPTLRGLMLAFTAVQVAAAPLMTRQTDSAAFVLEANGAFGAITRRADGRNYWATSQSGPPLGVKVDGVLHVPDSAAWDASARRLTLRYAKVGVIASLKAEAKVSHATLELVAVEPAGRATLALWGPSELA